MKRKGNINIITDSDIIVTGASNIGNNLTTVVDYTTNILINHGLKEGTSPQTINDITIYPKDFFNPMDMDSGKILITENTVSIHHYAATWVDDYSRFRGKVYQKLTSLFGKSFAEKIRKVVGRK